MIEKPPFDMNPFFWGMIIALLYLILNRIEKIIELLGGQP